MDADCEGESDMIHTNRKTTVHLRWLLRNDIAAVVRIERDSFVEEWTTDDFHRVLSSTNVIGMVAEYRGTVVGYVVYEVGHRNMHIINTAIHPAYRRPGIGSQFMEALVDRLSEHRRHKITATVREYNLSFQLFLKANGFRAVRCMRDWFPDSGEGAIRMVFKLPNVGVPF